MHYEEEKRKLVSFCGSYCHTCGWFTSQIRRTFQSALSALEEYGFNKLLQGKADRENLKQGLEVLARCGICSGCKAEIGKSPEEDRCQIRQCALGKGFDLCSQCSDFPCGILRSYPSVLKFGCIENLNDIRERGIEFWIDARWTGFVKEQED
jgi:hypothetical protein